MDTELHFEETIILTNESNDDLVVDALGSGVVKDYSRLMSEFGINPIDEVLKGFPKKNQHQLMTRGVMFGQTDLKPILDAAKNNEKFAVMTGIKPSGPYHIGSITTAQEVVYFQQLGGKVSFCIADVKSYISSELSFDKAEQIAVDNVLIFLH